MMSIMINALACFVLTTTHLCFIQSFQNQEFEIKWANRNPAHQTHKFSYFAIQNNQSKPKLFHVDELPSTYNISLVCYYENNHGNLPVTPFYLIWYPNILLKKSNSQYFFDLNEMKLTINTFRKYNIQAKDNFSYHKRKVDVKPANILCSTREMSHHNMNKKIVILKYPENDKFQRNFDGNTAHYNQMNQVGIFHTIYPSKILFSKKFAQNHAYWKKKMIIRKKRNLESNLISFPFLNKHFFKGSSIDVDKVSIIKNMSNVSAKGHLMVFHTRDHSEHFSETILTEIDSGIKYNPSVNNVDRPYHTISYYKNLTKIMDRSDWDRREMGMKSVTEDWSRRNLTASLGEFIITCQPMLNSSSLICNCPNGTRILPPVSLFYKICNVIFIMYIFILDFYSYI